MPQLGETVTEGTITRWLKHVGDRVEAAFGDETADDRRHDESVAVGDRSRRNVKNHH